MNGEKKGEGWGGGDVRVSDVWIATLVVEARQHHDHDAVAGDDGEDHEAKVISFSPSSNKYTITVAGGLEVGEVSGEELQRPRENN